jgi:tetratricopeptide (TPR) repeat protein
LVPGRRLLASEDEDSEIALPPSEHFLGIVYALKGIQKQELSAPVDRTLGVHEALQHLNAALLLEPSNKWVLFNLGLLKLRQGEYEVARDYFDQSALSNQTRLQVKSRQMKGYGWEFAGKVDEAQSYFTARRKGDLPLDKMEPDPQIYLRAPVHTSLDSKDYLCDIVVFYELYTQYVEWIQKLGLVNEIWPKKETSLEDGYFNVHELDQMINARKFFVDNDYVVLPQLVSPTEMKIAGRWFRSYCKTAPDTFEDYESQRYMAQNDRISMYYQHRMKDFMSVFSSESIKPSYTHANYYSQFPGSTKKPSLNWHIDRPDNDYTINLQIFTLDFANQPSNIAWPFYFDTNYTADPLQWREPAVNSPMVIKLNYKGDGDAILFRGRYHSHGRDHMPKTMKEALGVLLNYVTHDFDLYQYSLVLRQEKREKEKEKKNLENTTAKDDQN